VTEIAKSQTDDEVRAEAVEHFRETVRNLNQQLHALANLDVIVTVTVESGGHYWQRVPRAFITADCVVRV
jgi:hypothetical protein